MNRRTALLMGLMKRLPRPEPPTPAYLARVRRDLPPVVARVVLGPVASGVELETITVPVRDAEIKARIYRPKGATGVAPLVVNLHGGGFVYGNLTGSDWLCGQVAARAGVVVVSIDYRLAPEFPAPVPFQDCLAATTWLVEQAQRLGVDPQRVSLMGESAGGNLAALVALAWRDRLRENDRRPALLRQILLYPATDLTLSSASVGELEEAPMLRRTTLDWYGRRYLPQGRPDSLAGDDPWVSPIFAADHSELAPALIFAAGQDPLRDDALRYAETLRSAGVAARTVLYPDAIHGFVSIPLFEPAARQAVAEIVAELGS